MLAENYWIIDSKSIVIKSYSKNNFTKLWQVVTNYPQTKKIFYTTISQVEVVYTDGQRLSPFDFNSDSFYLLLFLIENKSLSLIAIKSSNI